MLLVKDLVKRYGSREALKGISFHIEEGQIVGLLGQNGAGKSTTMNIITGYLSSTSGEVMIQDMDILETPKQVKHRSLEAGRNGGKAGSGERYG